MQNGIPHAPLAQIHPVRPPGTPAKGGPCPESTARSICPSGKRSARGRGGVESGSGNTGEVLEGELLDGGNDVSQLLPSLGKLIFYARRDLQEGLPPHEPHLFQKLQPL